MATGFKLGDPREYRRGVVLGLTLAEVLVLLVFLLLLTMSALLLRRDREQTALNDRLGHYAVLLQPMTDALASRGVSIEDTDQLVSLIERGSTADRLRSQLDEAGRKLEAARVAREKQEGELSKLREATREIARMTEAVAEHAALSAILERIAGQQSQPLPEKLAGLVEKATTVEAATASLMGQNAQMRAELARLKGNGGSGQPYCWALPDGRTQYMLKVEMQDSGVIVRDLEPRARPEDPAWPLLDGVARGRLMPISEFITQTSPLQVRSNSERCRYAIQAVDGTGVTNKPGYKHSIGRLWSVFMVREVGR
jgi:hypothetical protein